VNKPHPLLQVLGHLWMLPLTLLGLLLIVVYSISIRAPYFQLPDIRWKDGRLEVVPLWIAFDPGAQTWGNIVFFCHVNARNDDDLVVHECCHIVQAMKYGPFYMVGYPAEAGVQYIKNPQEPEDDRRWWRAYMNISWERTAYRKQRMYMRGLLPGVWGART
jgi:hypothetical protein